jgi:WD40 repeat protein
MNIQTNPYVGPRAFTTDEQAHFFGRNREIRQLKSMLIAERLVLVHSPSGAGKTSLIHAGLLPEMARNRFHVLPVVRVNTLPTKKNPTNRYVYSAILSLEEGLTDEQRVPEEELYTLTLDKYLARRWRSESAPSSDLLVFDQFEEILTTAANDKKGKIAFFEQLSEALANTDRWALFAIREDYLGALAPYQSYLPGRLSSTFRLDLLGHDSAMQAAQKPAELAGITFETAAAEQLIRDLSVTQVQRPDGTLAKEVGLSVEPVQLQVVCYRIFEANQQDSEEGAKVIDLEDLKKAGDVNQVLGDYYRTAVTRAVKSAGVGERQVRDWFAHELISAAGIRLQVPKGTDYSKGLSNQAIDALVDSHIVRSENRSNITWFELAHDRLIDPLLQNNAEWNAANLKPFQIKAAQWLQAEKPTEMLLRGADLEHARQDQIDAAAAGTLTKDEEAFLKTSDNAWAKENLKPFQRQAELWEAQARSDGLVLRGIELDHAEKDAADLALTQTESDFMKASLAVRKREKREKRNQRIIRWLAVVASVLMVLAGVLMFSAIDLWNEAEGQKVIAETERDRAVVAGKQADDSAKTAEEERKKAEAAKEVAEKQEKIALEQERIARGLGLAFLSQNMPLDQVDAYQVSGLLAVKAAEFNQGFEVNQSLHRFLNYPVKPVATLKHEKDVHIVKFSPDGKWMASASWDSIVRIWETETGQEVHKLPIEQGIYRMAFSPDNTLLAVLPSDSRYVLIWDVASGREVNRVYQNDLITSFAFSPDGSQMVLGSIDGLAAVWGTYSSEPGGSLKHDGTVNSVDFSPYGEWVVSASDDGTARVWNANTGLAPVRLWHGTIVLQARFSPFGNWVVTSDDQGNAKVWEAATGYAISTYKHSNPAQTISFDSSGNWILSVGVNETNARVWEASSGNEIARLQHDGAVTYAAFSPAGDTVVTSSADSTARVWQAWSGLEIARVQHGSNVLSADFHPNSKWVVSGGYDATARIWEVDTGEEVVRFRPADGMILSASYAMDEQLVALVRGWENDVSIWNIETETSVTVPSLSYDPNAMFASTPDFHLVAFIDSAGLLSETTESENPQIGAEIPHTISIMETTSGSQYASFEPANVVEAIAFSQNGQFLASGGTGVMQLWDLSTRQEIAQMNLMENQQISDPYINSIALSPDGKFVITGSSGGTVYVWDVTAGKIIATMTHNDTVSAVAISQDGKRALSGSQDRTTRMWDVATGNELARIRHDDWVLSVAISLDGKYVVSSSIDRTARVWDLDLNKEVHRMQNNTSIESVSFSTDGTRLIAVTGDGVVNVRYNQTADLTNAVCSRLTRNMTLEEWTQFFPKENYELICPQLPGGQQ